MKKHLVKIFIFILFLFIILYVNTYVHEQGHIIAASRQNISFKLHSINWVPQIKGWGYGKVIPENEVECEKFNALSLQQKKKITHAGVKAEFIFIFPLLLILSFFIVKERNKLWKKDKFFLFLTILLFITLCSIIFITLKGNVFSVNPLIDWNFVEFVNCTVFG